MERLPDTIELGPEEEGRRVWDAALAARMSAPTDLVDLCSAIDLGLRAVEILMVHRLQSAKGKFPATIAAQLETPHPEIDTQRDAISIPSTLTFTDIVDLLSATDLECVSPGLHRGWEDRKFSCRRSRATASAAIGVTIQAAERDRLLMLSAYRNRLTRYPPPVRLEPHKILAAFDSLVPVAEKLLTG